MKFLFERRLPLSIKPEATLGERIDSRTSGQPDIPFSEDEKAEKTLLISSLTKQVLNSPKQIGVDCRFDQELCTGIEHFLVSHTDPVIHAEQNGNMERHEISKTEDHVQCQQK